MVAELQIGQDLGLPVTDVTSSTPPVARNLAGIVAIPAQSGIRKMDIAAWNTSEASKDRREHHEHEKAEKLENQHESKARTLASHRKLGNQAHRAHQHDGNEVDGIEAPEVVAAEEAAKPEVGSPEPVSAETETIEPPTIEKTRETEPETQVAETEDKTPEPKSNKWESPEAKPEAERPRDAEPSRSNPIPAALANALMQAKAALGENLEKLAAMQKDSKPQTVAQESLTPPIQDRMMEEHLKQRMQQQSRNNNIDVRGLA